MSIISQRFPRRIFCTILFLGIIFFTLVFAPSGRGQDFGSDDDCEKYWARFSWGEPTYGTPVHHYVVQVRVNPGTEAERLWGTLPVEEGLLYYDFNVCMGDEVEARVAGVDAQNRQGPWCLWTEIWSPEPEELDWDGN